jgi:catechol 2,3-dioxygenase-like lactoylglutathione lyase family enzyme
MFSHVMVGSNDIARSKRFYDLLFAEPGHIDNQGRLAYARGGALFMVSVPIDGRPACHANGGTIGFRLGSPGEVESWHSAGIEGGGTSIEDPPGWRDSRYGKFYLAYLRDPDGNKLCALYCSPE